MHATDAPCSHCVAQEWGECCAAARRDRGEELGIVHTDAGESKLCSVLIPYPLAFEREIAHRVMFGIIDEHEVGKLSLFAYTVCFGKERGEIEVCEDVSVDYDERRTTE